MHHAMCSLLPSPCGRVLSRGQRETRRRADSQPARAQQGACPARPRWQRQGDERHTYVPQAGPRSRAARPGREGLLRLGHARHAGLRLGVRARSGRSGLARSRAPAQPGQHHLPPAPYARPRGRPDASQIPTSANAPPALAAAQAALCRRPAQTMDSQLTCAAQGTRLLSCGMHVRWGGRAGQASLAAHLRVQQQAQQQPQQRRGGGRRAAQQPRHQRLGRRGGLRWAARRRLAQPPAGNRQPQQPAPAGLLRRCEEAF